MAELIRAAAPPHRSHGMGLHREKLSGRRLEAMFSPAADARTEMPDAIPVDVDKRFELDVDLMEPTGINARIRELMREGYGHIVLKNPGAKHSVGVGILNRLKLDIEGSLGYFGVGLIDGPNVRISGRVGWSCAENMLAGTVVIEQNAGSTFGAALRGGDLVCKGDVGARTGIDMKGGTILVGGRTGAFSGFMMQRGRMIVLGDAGKNLGDSMYDGVIYVGGSIAALGVDAVEAPMTPRDVSWLERKLGLYGMAAPKGTKNMTKVVAGKMLWNYDSLEPAEKKIVL